MQAQSLFSNINQVRHRRLRGKQQRENQGNECKYCGSQHDKGRCPAFGKLCKKCRKCNHFAKVCRSKQAKRVENIDKESERDSSDENTNGFFVDSVSQSENPQSQNKTTDKQCNIEMCSNQDDQTAWFIPINTSGSDINYKIDTGAQASIIPQRLYNSLRKEPKLHATKEKLFAYDGSEIPVVGKCIARLKPKGNTDYPVQFVIVSTKSCPILGLKHVNSSI